MIVFMMIIFLTKLFEIKKNFEVAGESKQNIVIYAWHPPHENYLSHIH